ncbi:unnamed protein product, partial [Adineta ricciae]
MPMNDSRPNVVVVVSLYDTIASVFLGYTNKAFVRQQTLATGSGSRLNSFIVSDFNRDHQLDFVATNLDDKIVRLLYKHSNRSFSSQNRTFNVRYQSEPWAVNIIDYNNDTFLDVTMANHCSSNVGIFLGFGNGSFDDLEMLSVGYIALPISVVIVVISTMTKEQIPQLLLKHIPVRTSHDQSIGKQPLAVITVIIHSFADVLTLKDNPHLTFCQYYITRINVPKFLSLDNVRLRLLFRVLRSTAGCGPMGLNIDKLLQKLNRNTLIPCCVQHDACYQTCGNKRSVCDDRFYTCLKTACSRQTPVSRECSTIATSMYTAVRGGGIPSFRRDQLNSKCAKKLIGTTAAHCNNGVRDTAETGSDCGGECSIGRKCNEKSTCNKTTDCDTGVCASNICLPAHCNNKIMDFSETGIDCGGPCANGKKCNDEAKCNMCGGCVSDVCESNVCLPAQCKNLVMDSGETGIDCGGVCAAGRKCRNYAGCAKDSDCASSYCASNVCIPSTCNNGVIDSNETGTDCGGVCVPAKKCMTYTGCKENIDCSSGLCSSDTCIPTECNNDILDSGETGIDCGGNCAPGQKCPDGIGCNTGSDCLFGNCYNGFLWYVMLFWKCDERYRLTAATCHSPCLNGGTCIAAGVCQCLLGLAGPTCAIQISCPTDSQPSASGTCVNTRVNFNNCGGIGVVCSGSDISCSNGICSTTIPPVVLQDPMIISSWGDTGTVDDQTTSITLPFYVEFYNYRTFTLTLSSNGVVCFGGCSMDYLNTNLPSSSFSNATIFAFWDDLYLAHGTTSQGIYYSTTGGVPNRQFTIEYYASRSSQLYRFQVE